jgi:hypothetical protein
MKSLPPARGGVSDDRPKGVDSRVCARRRDSGQQSPDPLDQLVSILMMAVVLNVLGPDMLRLLELTSGKI